MQRIQFLIILVVLGCNMPLGAYAQHVDYQVVPKPQEISLTGEEPFIIDGSCTILCKSADAKMQRNASFLSDYIAGP